MLSEVLKVIGELEPLEEYVRRNNCTVLPGLEEDGTLIAFIHRDPWTEELESVVVEGKTYIKQKHT